ncbi:alkaline phosphatase family protein [Candidatus Omnitrophota bacterium]
MPQLYRVKNTFIKRYKITIIILISAFLLLSMLYMGFQKDTRTKIVFMGFDGLEWSIIDELLKEDKMPTFDKLLRNSSYGNLKMPHGAALSPALWTTMATGRSPGIHGILDHIVHEDDSYEPVVVRSYHRKVKALWNMLTERERKVGVINYFATWPPEEINGFIVSNNALSGLDGNDVYPSNLAKEIDLLIEPFKVVNDNNNFLEKHATRADFEMDILPVMSQYLYQKLNKDLDLFIVYSRYPDRIQHFFWKFMEPEYFQHPVWRLTPELIERYGNIIKDMYQKIDTIVEGMLEHIDKDTIVIVCSDHGFERKSNHPHVRLDNLDQLLEAIGFLTFNESDKEIDFSKTKAYHYQVASQPYVFIGINLKVQNPHGIVESGDEYAQVKKALINALSSLTVVETGKRLFNEVKDMTFERAHIGLSKEKNIDLLKQHVKINENIYSLDRFFNFENISGQHKNHKGVFMIYGKNIKRAQLIKDAHMLDITPTILYLLGLAIARDMEGKILVQAIDEDFIRKNPIKYISTYEDKGEYERKEQREQLEMLRSLGYIQ